MKNGQTEYIKDEKTSQKQIVVSFTTSADLVQQMKLLSIKNGQKLKDSFKDALEDWIEKYS